jgi:signal transduction histidine kinase
MTEILVVDDNEQNRYMAEVLLSGNGYRVVTAVNGADALEKARFRLPDLVLADILMPVLDGFALCREWRQDARLKSVPFIFYTATYTDPEDEKFALSLGADRFLVKPMSPESLLNVIKEVLAQFRSGQLQSDAGFLPEESVYLKEYNQTLIHKLEDKLSQLEATNRALHEEIERRKQIEGQLVQAQRMEAIGTLAGGIAHDFNNMLSAIMGHIEIALMDTRSGNPPEKHFLEALNACNRAKELVMQILTFSRPTEMDRQPVLVKPIVAEAIELIRSSLPDTIEINRNLKSDAKIMSNPTQIYQVVMNLCTNAGHAMKARGGVLTVTLVDVMIDEAFAALDRDVVLGLYQKLAISDTGEGMMPDQIARIFEPYFTTKKKQEGTGLGLSVVHGIVKNSGGMISVESKPGRGSTFNVFFPVIKLQNTGSAKNYC